MGKKIIQDVAEVIVTNIDTGKIVMIGEGTTTGISQTISEEKVKAGIGNKTIYLIRSDKEINLNIVSATFDTEFFAMTQGVSVDEAGTGIVTRSVKVKAKDNMGSVEITIPNAPVGLTEAIVAGADEEQSKVTVTTGVAIVPVGILAGEEVTVFYKEDITGRSIEMNSSKFASKFRVEYRTIAYDIATATVDSDIYYIFDECIPSGAFDMALQNGTVYSPEINFSVTNPIGSDTMGTYYEVPRK